MINDWSPISAQGGEGLHGNWDKMWGRCQLISCHTREVLVLIPLLVHISVKILAIRVLFGTLATSLDLFGSHHGVHHWIWRWECFSLLGLTFTPLASDLEPIGEMKFFQIEWRKSYVKSQRQRCRFHCPNLWTPSINNGFKCSEYGWNNSTSKSNNTRE